MVLQQLYEQIEARVPLGFEHTRVLINGALREFSRRSRFINKTVELLTIVAPGFPLPDDFVEIRKVFWDVNRTPSLAVFPEAFETGERVPRLVASSRQSRSRGPVWKMAGSRKAIYVGYSGPEGFTAFPSGSVDITYVAHDVTLVELDDESLIPDEYMDAILCRVMEPIHSDRGEPDKQRYCYAKWSDAIKDAKREALRRNGADGIRPHLQFI